MKQNNALSRTWKQARQELFSPEEIAVSNAKVELMIALSKARKKRRDTKGIKRTDWRQARSYFTP